MHIDLPFYGHQNGQIGLIFFPWSFLRVRRILDLTFWSEFRTDIGSPTALL